MPRTAGGEDGGGHVPRTAGGVDGGDQVPRNVGDLYKLSTALG